MSLDRLVGTWQTEARFPNGVSGTGRRRSSSCWAGSTCSSARRSRSTAARGPDDDRARRGRRATQHYFDSRGVARRYAMTLEGDTWTLERDGVQRYLGRFEDDDTIRGAWEWFRDGAWQHDFELDYRRSVAP